MRPTLACLPVVVVLALTACDKEDAKGAGGAPSASASASAAPAASPAPSTTAPPAPSAAPSSSAAPAPLPKCPAGLTGNAVPAYCIKLPASYKVKEARTTATRGSVDYDTGSTTDILTVSYDGTSFGELAKDVESEMKFGGDKLEKKGDLPGGNKWFRGTHADYARVVTLVKAPPLTLKCSFAYQPKKAPPAEAIDACKSIVLP
jgi:hypothetical protein